MLAARSSPRSSTQSNVPEGPPLQPTESVNGGLNRRTNSGAHTPFRSSNTVVYASSTQRRAFSDQPNTAYGSPAHAPFPIAMAGYRPDSRQFSDNGRNTTPAKTWKNSERGPYGTPFPAQEEQIFSEDDSEFVDDEFKRLVEELDNEEFTQLNGFMDRHQNAFDSVPRHTAHSTDIKHEEEQSEEEISLEEQFPQDQHDEPLYTSELPTSTAPPDEGYSTQNYLNAPTLELLDAELDDLDDEGQGNYVHDQDFSKLEGLTDLEITGLERDTEDVRYDEAIKGSPKHYGRDIRTQLPEPWDSSLMGTPTPVGVGGQNQRGESLVSSENRQSQYKDPGPYDTASAKHSLATRDIESPESSLGVLSPENEHFNDNIGYISPSPTPRPHHQGRMAAPELKAFPSPFGATVDQMSFTQHDENNSPSQPEHATHALESPYQEASTPHLRIAGGTDSSPFQDMLIEARNECQSLRALNERLLQQNEELKANLDAAMDDKRQFEINLRAEYEQKLRAVRQEESEKNQLLQQDLASVREELEKSRIAQDQMASIRSTLQREKDLDILSIKKELAAQKERQLKELRREMAVDKEELSRKLKEEMRIQENNFHNDKERLENEISRLRKAVMQRDDDLAQLEERLYTRSRRPDREDFGQQYDGYSDMVQHLEREISQIRSSYEATLSAVQSQLDGERKRSDALKHELTARANIPSSPKNLSLNELMVNYPTQLRQFRETVEREHSEELSAQKAAHATALQNMMDRHQTAMSEAASRNEEERMKLVAQQRQEILHITSRLKEQCAQAYDLAIQKLKADYAKSEEKLAERYAAEKAAFVNEVKIKYSALGSSGRYTEKDERGEMWRNRVQELEDTVSSLKDALARAALEHNQALLDAKHRNTRDLQESLQKMKGKYLDTLRTMRDDLARSKQQGLERLEMEWRRRKEQLDMEWEKKLEDVVSGYEDRKVRTFTSNSPPRSNGYAVHRTVPESKRGPPSSSSSATNGVDINRAAWKPPGGSSRLRSSATGTRMKQTRFHEPTRDR
ncbi:uncharacterized protein SPPG_06912 [Spizellomyces punctatus DAOM BR117]|uniref:Uncharacterized protein n=1 Tax=Spizellomyces punctatus (strain DAOM BR117) TaxID=645134 RepID=A0A0L0H9Q5_SPIPD|nr:uncharacterized protein SPPG_06912 [Spizellomyces punctatus DAOM BR117]KNC97922.1 hypothetical protein SPPG_06912 [Spizellomyces punctatus DAOM BR117]|eukprot:XP_016605962.1 hypothetical protein SPPG_06912 [Spizellomyces punctatus DAOM BR117]